MPATPINKLPLGLLGFLGIKNGGEYPRDLAAFLTPNWDLEELYCAANSEVQQFTRADVAGVGYYSLFTVPNGEIWRVDAMHCACNTLGAGQTLQLGLAMTDPAGTTTVQIANPSNSASTGGRAYCCMDRALFIGPGYTVGLVVTLVTAGPIAVTMGVRFARFQI